MTAVISVDARTGAAEELPVAQAGPAEVDAAVRAAAATAPALAVAGLAGRGRLLCAMADAIEADGDAIVAAADRESALGPGRLRGELGRTAYQLRLFAQVLADGAYLEITIDHPDPDALPAPRPDLRRMLVPLGPVAVFPASNFPLAFSVAGGDTASALAAGCPVVVKAHPGHPRTSELTAAALRRAAASVGLPEEVVRLVHGRAAGADLVRHPLIQAVGFTGSLAGGRALFDLACARPEPIPFYGELGSINPLVVTAAAAAERAESIGRGLAASFTLGLGQFCTKPGLAFVPAGPDGDRLVGALVTAASNTAVPSSAGGGAAAGGGSAAAEGVMLTAAIRDGFLDGAAQRVGHPAARPLLAADGRVAPHVVTVPAAELTELFWEECFGPIVVLVRYADPGDLLAALDRLPGTLTATVHNGANEDGPDSLAARAGALLAGRAGRLIWNGFPTGVAVTWAMQHGGPYPSATFAGHTSVGTTAIRRFLRPVAYQDTPPGLLPPELREDNPLRLPRRVDGRYQVDG